MAPAAHDRGDAVEIRIPPQTEYLAMVRGFVSEVVAQQAGVDARRLEDLRVALSEAVTNAIAAHARRRSADPIRIRCVPSPGRVEIQVHDRGGGFDPSSVPEPPEPTDPRRLHAEKGMGLWLMRVMSDDHAIASSRSGTEVRLVVHTSAT
ncbi:MAG: ATP-binding protein [bacterium]|nr:ATP-binding protein [bacterium]